MKITKGKNIKAAKVVIYGPEGIGKSTLSSKFPDPVFIDTEGGTARMDVARLDTPTSWTMLLEEVDWIKSHTSELKTLVIDTADWAEKLCVAHVCAVNHWSSVEQPGYGAGYRYVYEAYGKLLNSLSDVVELGINVVLNAHAMMRKFEQPDELGSYDRWELKLQSSQKCNISAMVKEWADMVLFCNYKTLVTNVGTEKAKNYKASGGKRVMYTSHHSCWDAKNRDGLPDELPMEYESIRSVIECGAVRAPETKPETKTTEISAESIKAQLAKTSAELIAHADQKASDLNDGFAPQRFLSEISRIPKALVDLMEDNDVTEDEIQRVCFARGYYPAGTLIQSMDPNFISGCLVGAWNQVFALIKESREKGAIPFN